MSTQEEVKSKGEEAKTTALAIPIEGFRHPLMVDVIDKEYIKRAEEELIVDHKLGLKKQAEATAKTILEKDIDELTNSKDYYEVDKKTIGQLFGLDNLKARCISHNVKEAVTQTLKGAGLAMMFIGMCLTAFYFSFGACHFASVHNTAGPILGAIVVIAAAIAAGGSAIWAFVEKTSFHYKFIDVTLNIEPLEDTTIKIPYGCKLKALDALNSGIFSGFAIVTPQFKEVSRDFNKPFKPEFNFDPAIVGVTSDKRLFMIVYWDLEQDREKVIKDITHFKKFKYHSK